MNELDLFTEALGRTDPAERAAYLDQACAGNPELRRRLAELLTSHAGSGSSFDRPPLAPGEHQGDLATATLAHAGAGADATTAIESGAGRPARQRSGRAKGSARSLPGGTRWSR